MMRSDFKSLKAITVFEYPSPNDLKKESAINWKDQAENIGAVGQTFMQANRPRASLYPLHIGLSIQLNHN